MPHDLSLHRIRSILETPILDEHKWAKVPTLPADAFLLDMEDSVPPAAKPAARERVIEFLARPEYFGGRRAIARPNALGTPWGRADLEALARAAPRTIAYPKCSGPQELRDALQILQAGGARPEVLVIVETARAVLELEQIAGLAAVAGLMFGPSDLALDAGFEVYDGPALHDAAFHYPKSKLVLCAAAHQLPAFDMVMLPDVRDVDRVQAQLKRSRRLGFTGAATFYPPHLEHIHAAFTPDETETARARAVIAAYEDALGRGAAALAAEGQTLIVQDYERARRLISRARS
jgi:citrate lyase beta subunit